MTRTYSLAEAAEQICGDSMKRPVLYMKRRIKDGTFRASKVGRHLRMSERQIADALKALEIGAPKQQPQRRLGVTAASLRRRSA